MAFHSGGRLPRADLWEDPLELMSQVVSGNVLSVGGGVASFKGNAIKG